MNDSEDNLSEIPAWLKWVFVFLLSFPGLQSLFYLIVSPSNYYRCGPQSLEILDACFFIGAALLFAPIKKYGYGKQIQFVGLILALTGMFMRYILTHY